MRTKAPPGEHSEADRAEAAVVIKAITQIRDEIIWPERERHHKAQLWQELAVCEKFADAITAKIKVIEKEFGLCRSVPTSGE